MAKLSKAQENVVNVFYRWRFCRVARFADTKTKTAQYAVEFWNDGGRKRQIYPNPRTIESLIRWGVLVHNAESGTYELAPGWQPKNRVAESEAAE